MTITKSNNFTSTEYDFNNVYGVSSLMIGRGKNSCTLHKDKGVVDQKSDGEREKERERERERKGERERERRGCVAREGLYKQLTSTPLAAKAKKKYQ